jgi:transposase InsO family protein
MKFACIAKYQQEYPVSLLCHVLEVSVSGYYAWKQRVPSQRQREDERLALRIQQVHHASHQIYGSRRIRAELAAHGQSCGRKRVVRLMRKLGICSKPRRRHHISTTDSQHSDPVAANLLDRDFTAEIRNTKWVTDITGVWTAQGWLYVAVVLDLFSRMVVGWAMAPHRDSELVELALHMALAHRHPGPGLLCHSDRGSQYTSASYQVLLAQAGIQVSMSRKGNCYDNATMESFIGSLKEEWTDRRSYQSFEEAQQSIFEYIEVFYNRSRRHSSLDYLSPAVYEQLYSG